MNTSNPKWWNDTTTSSWERVKTAFKRDWEQTKHDLTGKGAELRQDAGDTIKQAAGKEAIPPGNTPNAPDWSRDENALRYGWGAGSHDSYKTYSNWDDKLEGKLKEEWNDLKSGRTWEEAKSAVRGGWDRARAKVS